MSATTEYNIDDWLDSPLVRSAIQRSNWNPATDDAATLLEAVLSVMRTVEGSFPGMSFEKILSQEPDEVARMKLNEDLADIQEELRAGATARQVAERYGTTKHAVYAAKRAAGLTGDVPAALKGSKGKTVPKDMDVLRKCMEDNNNCTVTRAAKILGWNVHTTLKHAKRAGIGVLVTKPSGGASA